MGATVLTGKRAGAFQRADGEWIFALFERTYEKNCYPHRDHWSGITIGNYASVMRRVFHHATSCEGGMLQSRSGDIRPEVYIESWRQELAKPMMLHDRQVDLRVGKAFDAIIPEKSLDDVRQRLAKVDLQSRFDALVAGGLSVSLHEDVDVLIALYGEGGPFSLWRVLTVNACGSVPVTAPVPRLLPAVQVISQMPDVRCHAIDGENRLVSVDGKPWHHAGWQYNAVGSFITDLAYDLDMAHPGFAKRAIPEYRDMLRKALPVPRDTALTISRAPVGVSKWAVASADELAQGIGIAASGQDAPQEYRFLFSELLAKTRSICSINWGISNARRLCGTSLWTNRPTNRRVKRASNSFLSRCFKRFGKPLLRERLFSFFNTTYVRAGDISQTRGGQEEQIQRPI